MNDHKMVKREPNNTYKIYFNSALDHPSISLSNLVHTFKYWCQNWLSSESFLAGVAFSNRANKLSLIHRLDKVDANIYNGIFSNVFPIIAAFIKLYVIYTVDLRDC